MDYQRKLSAGVINKEEENRVKEKFKDIQRVLKPIAVRNPYATKLKIPKEVFKPLRTNAHYLHFIEAITFYHQYQRKRAIDKITGEEYIESTLEDIKSANWLLSEVLLSKSDELNKSCRDFYEALKNYMDLEKLSSIYAKHIRGYLKISPSSLNRHLNQLVRYGYLKIVGGDKYKRGYEYEIINKEEYRNLKDNVKNALDQALKNIEYPSVPSVSQSVNGILKSNTTNTLKAVSQ